MADPKPKAPSAAAPPSSPSPAAPPAPPGPPSGPAGAPLPEDAAAAASSSAPSPLPSVSPSPPSESKTPSEPTSSALEDPDGPSPALRAPITPPEFDPLDPTPPPLRPPFHDTSAPREREPRFTLSDEDVEAQRAWMEERYARRLRGEYESMGRRVNEVIQDSLDKPLNLSAIRLVGSPHTRTSFLSGLFAPYLSSPTPQTLSTILRSTKDLHAKLQSFDLYSSLDLSLEDAASVLARPGDVDLVVHVREKGRVWARSSTDVGNGEGSASASVRLRNVFGGAETLEFNASYGTRTRSAVQARLASPLPAPVWTPDPRTTVDLAVFQADRDHGAYAGYHELLKGGKARLVTQKEWGTHEFAYETVWRHISNLSPNASLSIRAAAGHSLKSALSHTFTRDTRDDAHLSTRGHYVKLFTEYAGLGGTVSFLKSELESQISRPVSSPSSGSFFSLATRLGALAPLGPSASNPSALFPDRFRLGGPTSLRMFGTSRVGPRDGEDHLGGELYYALGLSLFTPFPRRREWKLRPHFFVNAGQLVSLSNPNPLRALARPSISAGAGLMYRFDPVRVELNFGVPLAAARSDVWGRGVQVGVGLEFL